MTTAASPAETSAPPWRGIHHIALVTRDLDATIQFYTDVLGMRLVATAPAGDMHGRTAVFSDGGSYVGFHFFEFPGAEIAAPPDLNTMYWLPGALHHISVALPDAAAGEAFMARLHARNIATTPIMDQGDLLNMMFLDNNGITLEAAWPKP